MNTRFGDKITFFWQPKGKMRFITFHLQKREKLTIFAPYLKKAGSPDI